jgi:UDP-3-O-[3-hydroxymyristoyl] glucosamine N-acyltransferase
MVKSGTTIGMEGFGFAQDANGKNHRIPQLGIVQIEDDVVLGASCNIDRATYGETRIRSGSVLDAFCHIAHNVDVGENCILIAQTGVAGSVTLGKRNIISGQTGITDHVHTVDDVILLHKAGVMSSVEQPGAYAGTPVQPLKAYFRNVAVSHRLVELNKRLKKLEKQLESI